MQPIDRSRPKAKVPKAKVLFGWGADWDGAALFFVWFANAGAEPSQQGNIPSGCVQFTLHFAFLHFWKGIFNI